MIQERIEKILEGITPMLKMQEELRARDEEIELLKKGMAALEAKINKVPAKA